MFARVVTVLDVDNTCMYSRHLCWGCRHARYALGAPVWTSYTCLLAMFVRVHLWPNRSPALACVGDTLAFVTRVADVIIWMNCHSRFHCRGYQGRTTVCSRRPWGCAWGCCCHLSLHGTEFARRFCSCSSRFLLLLLLSSTDVFAITL